MNILGGVGLMVAGTVLAGASCLHVTHGLTDTTPERHRYIAGLLALADACGAVACWAHVVR